jgi:hypothetical protein
MRDWVEYVKARLRVSGLEDAEEQDMIEELAGHLEETYLSLCSRGVSEPDAGRLASDQVKNWEKLRSQILSAKQEVGMENRTAQLWIPAVITLLSSAGLLVVLEVLGVHGVVIHGSGLTAIFVNPPWLLGLIVCGALGTFLAQRAKAGTILMHLSSVFPVLLMATAMIVVFVAALLLDRNIFPVFDMAMVGAGIANGVLLPGIALLIGNCLFRLFKKGSRAAA